VTIGEQTQTCPARVAQLLLSAASSRSHMVQAMSTAPRLRSAKSPRIQNLVSDWTRARTCAEWRSCLTTTATAIACCSRSPVIADDRVWRGCASNTVAGAALASCDSAPRRAVSRSSMRTIRGASARARYESPRAGPTGRQR